MAPWLGVRVAGLSLGFRAMPVGFTCVSKAGRPVLVSGLQGTRELVVGEGDRDRGRTVDVTPVPCSPRAPEGTAAGQSPVWTAQPPV